MKGVSQQKRKQEHIADTLTSMNKSHGERRAVTTGHYQKQWMRGMAVNGSAEEAGIGSIMKSLLYRHSKKLRFDLRDMGCQKSILYRDNTARWDHGLCQGAICQSYLLKHGIKSKKR